MEFNLNLSDYFGQLTPGKPWVRDNLLLFPLTVQKSVEPPDYLLLDEALALGVLEVREVDQAGSVNQVRVLNRSPKPVLILDGEELLGAKQNRLVNATLLIPACIEIVIPVSCVERGRWSYQSDSFQRSEAFGYSTLRQQKASQVSTNLRRDQRFEADQGAVWEEINRKQRVMQSDAPTDAMHGIYVDYEQQLNHYVEGIQPGEGQIGVMAFINGGFNCLDVLGHPDSLGHIWNKLLKSYAMEAIECLGHGKEGITGEPMPVLAALSSASPEYYKSPGSGIDIRIQTPQYIGAGLADQRRVLHFSAFPARRQTGHQDGKMARPSRRRRSCEN